MKIYVTQQGVPDQWLQPCDPTGVARSVAPPNFVNRTPDNIFEVSCPSELHIVELFYITLSHCHHTFTAIFTSISAPLCFA